MSNDRKRPIAGFGWDTSSSCWGSVWTQVACSDTDGAVVEAGLSGSVSGVTVARLKASAAARFARDFQDGKVFALCNNAEWVAMVKGAHAARRFDTRTFHDLVSYGRTDGLTIEGEMVSQDDLAATYL